MKISSCKAAILVNQNQALEIDTIHFPEALEYGQVLVKLSCSGICGSQIGEITGAKGEDKYLPHLLGHEGSGTVIECGPGVTHVQENDAVVLHWRKGKGIESKPPKYSWNGNQLNAGFVTTFNEYAIVSENRLTKIPNNFSKEIAALFGCAVTTGFGVINNNAQLKIGESVLVYGAGGVGLNIIQAAAMSSGHPIIAIDRIDSKLELAKKFGATHVLNSKKSDIIKEVSAIVGPTGVDVAIDNTGNPDVIAQCYQLTQPKGKTILVGVVKKDQKISFYPLPIHFGKTITGSHGGECNPSTDIPNYLRLYEYGKLDLSQLITDTYSLDEINIGIEKIIAGEVSGRCLISILNG